MNDLVDPIPDKTRVLIKGMDDVVRIRRCSPKQSADASHYLEQMYRLHYPPHRVDSWFVPGVLGTRRWAYEELVGIVREVLREL